MGADPQGNTSAPRYPPPHCPETGHHPTYRAKGRCLTMSNDVWETPHGVKMRFPTDSKPYYRLDYVLGGKRRQPSVGKDQDIAWAEALRADTLVAVDDGDLSELSAADMFEAWYAEGCTHWTDHYKNDNRDLLDRHILHNVQHVAVADLRRSHIAAAVADANTVRMSETVRAACSSALKWAEQQGWIQATATSLLPPKPRKTAGRAPGEKLDPSEIPDVSDVLALAECVAQPRRATHKRGRTFTPPEYRKYTILIGGFCGLRIGEMLALRGSAVQGDLINVTEQVQYIRGKGLVVTAPKWGSVRQVVVPAQAGEYQLAEWVQARAEEVGPNGLLFPAPNGGLWDPHNYRDAVVDPARAQVWAGKKWTYHSLRHTFCTSLLAQNVSIADVASMAGHKSTNVTAGTYIGKQASALDRVRSIVNKEQ